MLGVDMLGNLQPREPTDIDPLSPIFHPLVQKQEKRSVHCALEISRFWGSGCTRHAWQEKERNTSKTHSSTWNSIIRLTYSSQKRVYLVTENSLPANTSISHYSLHFIIPSFIPCLELCSFPPISAQKKNLSVCLSAAQLSWRWLS